MKITDLDIGVCALIKYIKASKELRIHLMELGLVKGTLIKILKKSNYLIIIRYRNVDIVLTKDIGDLIDCTCR